MNRPLSRILALVLLAGVAFFVARPYLAREEAAAPAPALAGLVSERPRSVLELPRVERRLRAIDREVSLTQLGSATIQHELRFNDYDFAWLEEEEDVRTVVSEHADARASGEVVGFVALTRRGERFGKALAQDPLLRDAAASIGPPADEPTGTINDPTKGG